MCVCAQKKGKITEGNENVNRIRTDSYIGLEI